MYLLTNFHKYKYIFDDKKYNKEIHFMRGKKCIKNVYTKYKVKKIRLPLELNFNFQSIYKSKSNISNCELFYSLSNSDSLLNHPLYKADLSFIVIMCCLVTSKS